MPWIRARVDALSRAARKRGRTGGRAHSVAARGRGVGRRRTTDVATAAVLGVVDPETPCPTGDVSRRAREAAQPVDAERDRTVGSGAGGAATSAVLPVVFEGRAGRAAADLSGTTGVDGGAAGRSVLPSLTVPALRRRGLETVAVARRGGHGGNDHDMKHPECATNLTQGEADRRHAALAGCKACAGALREKKPRRTASPRRCAGDRRCDLPRCRGCGSVPPRRRSPRPTGRVFHSGLTPLGPALG
jgi:hypothetical protein